MVRRVVLVAVALVAGSLLAGCAGRIGVIGIERNGEHIHAVEATCDGHVIDQFRLVEDGGQFEDSWEVSPGRNSSDLGVFDDAVTATDTGNTFTLSASSSTTSDTIAGPTFTSDDLAQLNDGWVLIDDSLDDYPVIFVSEEKFLDLSGVC